MWHPRGPACPTQVLRGECGRVDSQACDRIRETSVQVTWACPYTTAPGLERRQSREFLSHKDCPVKMWPLRMNSPGGGTVPGPLWTLGNLSSEPEALRAWTLALWCQLMGHMELTVGIGICDRAGIDPT
ncbi:hypothetical protein TREES_T100020736 [Tupaia chinensis]|uniref:Uncharacterized protein n=1 Tax=Tupaia chinensis TaxID=246437 RepID=L9KBN7_TUPCH|nr:hypothetical protein TREES_T100020736 [Tupaia chinensis]